MRFKRHFVFIIICFASATTFAYTPREGNINAVIGPFFYRPNLVLPSEVGKVPDRAGFGIIALGDNNNRGSLEISMFFLTKSFLRESGPNVLFEELSSVHISMGYRWWLSERFSAGLTFFSSYPLSDYHTVYSRNNSAELMDTSARDLTEYGFDFSLQTEIWDNKKWAVVLDTRYQLSVTNKEHEQGDHYGVMIGIRYLIQEKKASDPHVPPLKP